VPAVGLGEGEDAAVSARAPALGPGAGLARVAEHDPVRAQSADQLDRQVLRDVGQAGDVVAGVHHDEDVRIASAPVACRDDAVDDLTQLGRGDGGRVVGRS
jgi:hypothetical protein